MSDPAGQKPSSWLSQYQGEILVVAIVLSVLAVLVFLATS
jgi:hypothetical protein